MADETAPATPAPPSLAPLNVDPAMVAAMAPESRATAAAALRKAGHDGAGVDSIFVTPFAPAPDTRTIAEKNFDQAFPAGNAAEIARGLDLRPIAGEGHDVAEVGAFTADLSGALVELGLPTGASSSLGSEMIANASRSQGMTPEAISLDWENNQKPLVTRLAEKAGMDWAAVSANVKLALDRVNTEMRGEIIRSGALNSAGAVLALALHGQRLAARAAMAPKK